MSANQDFKEMFKTLNEESVDYLIIGAHAVIYFTEPRYTKDLDVWVRPSPENAEKTWKALVRFGAPLRNMTKDDFTNKGLVYQIGIEPNRVDVLMGVGGVDFEDAWQNCIETSYDGIPIKIIGKSELIKAKRAAGRPQDIIDLERLENA